MQETWAVLGIGIGLHTGIAAFGEFGRMPALERLLRDLKVKSEKG